MKNPLFQEKITVSDKNLQIRKKCPFMSPFESETQKTEVQQISRSQKIPKVQNFWTYPTKFHQKNPDKKYKKSIEVHQKNQLVRLKIHNSSTYRYRILNQQVQKSIHGSYHWS